jgi:hypothetical protein
MLKCKSLHHFLSHRNLQHDNCKWVFFDCVIFPNASFPNLEGGQILTTWKLERWWSSFQWSNCYCNFAAAECGYILVHCHTTDNPCKTCATLSNSSSLPSSSSSHLPAHLKQTWNQMASALSLPNLAPPPTPSPAHLHSTRLTSTLFVFSSLPHSQPHSCRGLRQLKLQILHKCS